MKRVTVLLLAISLFACGSGDNSAVRAFYPTVQPGDALPELIAEGEKAQPYDIEYSVSALGCPGDELYIERHYEHSIRVTSPPPDDKRPSERPYNETGYAGREDFARGLPQVVPKFYSCKEFRFRFVRYQGWPNSDSFNVTVNAEGRVTSVSPLKEDPSY